MDKYEHEGYCRTLARDILPHGPESEREELAAVARAELIRASSTCVTGRLLAYAGPVARMRVLDAWKAWKRHGIKTRKILKRCLLPDETYAVETPVDVPDGFWPRILAVLPYRQMQVVYMIYRLGMSHGEAAETIGSTRSNVWQIHDKALAELRARFPRMEDYLG